MHPLRGFIGNDGVPNNLPQLSADHRYKIDVFAGFASAPAAICVLTQQVIAYGNTCFNVQDYSAAIENIFLAVSALGYASCWVEGYVTGESSIGAKMAATLGVPREYQVAAYLPIGMPEQEFACVNSHLNSVLGSTDSNRIKNVTKY